MIDLVVVGGGPAGLSAAIQGARDGLEVRLMSDEPPGGLLRAAYRVENFPGFPAGIPGADIADRMYRQACRFGVVCEKARIESVKWCDGRFVVVGTWPDAVTKRLESSTVVAATGTRPKPWCVSGLNLIPADMAADMIHRDVRSLPQKIAGCTVYVVGGGEAAFDSALTAASRGACVRVLVRGGKARAGRRLVDCATASGIDVLNGTELTNITCDMAGRRLVLNGGRLFADHLIVCTGRIPDTDLFADAFNSQHPSCEVGIVRPGFFTAGDVIRGRDRFVASAVGDGIRAARLAGRCTGTIE